LPGSNDGYSVNAGTILRDDADGKWHQASPAWDALMLRLTTAASRDWAVTSTLHKVRTGSSSDRVDPFQDLCTINRHSDIRNPHPITRSLPLPVLTSSLLRGP
jgi:hypothetical protein